MLGDKRRADSRSTGTKRRYVGRSSSRPAPAPASPAYPERAQLPVRPLHLAESTRMKGAVLQRQIAEESSTHALALRWPIRLVVSLVLIGMLATGLRAIGLFEPPLHPESGVEATYAATANILAG